MLRQEFTVDCKQGFHLRPAQMLMEAATGFSATIIISKNGSDMEVDARSILGLMSLGLEYGQAVTVTADGSDEAEALKAIGHLFETNFGE